MAIISGHHPLAFTFGLLGNIVSFMVYLAPLPTFYTVYKRKNTEGFQSLPYVVALFSAMLWLYYSFIKPNGSGSMLLTINSIGCVIETLYIIIYLIYAPRPSKILTFQLLFLLNVAVFGAIVLFTILFSEGAKRVTVVGWICSAFAVSVFAAPLSIMRLVIKTKSVEYMPISLSFSLTLCAIMWFFYGLLMKDPYVACPNILGFAFGIAQMALYIVYRDAKPKTDVISEIKLAELVIDIDLSTKEDLKTQPSINDTIKQEETETQENVADKVTVPNDCKV
ncbi:Bidirectional sugar transporter sweet14 [Ranunculus cassubicifolius]